MVEKRSISSEALHSTITVQKLEMLVLQKQHGKTWNVVQSTT